MYANYLRRPPFLYSVSLLYTLILVINGYKLIFQDSAWTSQIFLWFYQDCLVFRTDIQVSHPIDTERCWACCQGVCRKRPIPSDLTFVMQLKSLSYKPLGGHNSFGFVYRVLPKKWLSETTGGLPVRSRASRHAIVTCTPGTLGLPGTISRLRWSGWSTTNRVPAVSESHLFGTPCVVISMFSCLGSTCSSICLPLLAQVAREQKRLDARVMWLEAFSQVAPDISELWN